ncbi:protoporphyrinogen/coproporphyrinogen oxidase [Tessaracoccus lapidicaptus]|uniref:protoporphyrinogen/coproporphyrinogen oxidase n=1 Tax=Tessaracoccus lapidicaptus TaxID=1427523 RepID=UPI00333E4EA8
MTAVVVGGGLAGLVAGYRLAQAGRRVTVLEASTRLGGLISPIEIGGVAVDAGAEAYAVRGGVVRELCEELGLPVAAPLGRPHIWRPDGVWPMAEGVLGIPASLEDPALDALDPQDRARVARDLDLPAEVGAEATTLGDLVLARMGEGALRTLVTPVARGVYSLEPGRMPLASFAPGLREALAREGSLLRAVAAVRRPGAAAVEQPVGGMFRLIDALAAHITGLGGEIRCTSPAVDVHRAGTGFAVSLQDGGSVRGERLVLAGPSASACGLLAKLGVDLAPTPTQPAHLAVLGLNHPGLAAEPVGSGLLVGERDDSVHAKALTHYSVKWPWSRRPGQEIVRLSYPETYIPSRADALADAARFLRIPLSDADVTGFAAVSWEEMPTRMEHATRDFYLEAAAGVGVDVVGAWIDGNGIASVVAGSRRVLR